MEDTLAFSTLGRGKKELDVGRRSGTEIPPTIVLDLRYEVSSKKTAAPQIMSIDRCIGNARSSVTWKPAHPPAVFRIMREAFVSVRTVSVVNYAERWRNWFSYVVYAHAIVFYDKTKFRPCKQTNKRQDGIRRMISPR